MTIEKLLVNNSIPIYCSDGDAYLKSYGPEI